MIRSRVVLTALLVAAVGAGPAAGQSVTGTINAGESLRSSSDPAPSPTTPVIVTVSSRPYQGAGAAPQSTFTIAFSDHAKPKAPERGVWVGPSILLKSEGEPSPGNDTYPASYAVEVDKSLLPAGWLREYNVEVNAWDVDALNFSNRATALDSLSELPDGDLRITHQGAPPGCMLTDGCQIGVSRAQFVVKATTAAAPAVYQEAGDPELSLGLADAVKRGVPAIVVSNYRAATTVKVTVARATAKRLKLKSTTLGSAKFDSDQTNRKVKRVVLSPVARKALKRVKNVPVTIEVVAASIGDETAKDTQDVLLK